MCESRPRLVVPCHDAQKHLLEVGFLQRQLGDRRAAFPQCRKEALQLRSNTDFLADAVALFRWAVSERRLGHRIIAETLTGERNVLVFPRLERVAPEANLPRTEIAWTESELASLAELVSSPDPQPPTDALIRAMRD